MSERRCILEQAIGRSVRCSCSECPFWEEGGAVLQPGCLLGRLLPGEDWTPELAGAGSRSARTSVIYPDPVYVSSLMGETATVSRIGGMAAELLLVSTEECHFCERAHDVLADLDIKAREISVTSPEAEALARRGIPLVILPVLTDGERVIAYGRFSEKRLRKELDR